MPHAWGDSDPTPAEPGRTTWGDVRPYAPTWDDTPDADATQAHTPTWDDMPGADAIQAHPPAWDDMPAGDATQAHTPTWDDRRGYGPTWDDGTRAYAPTSDDDAQAQPPAWDDPQPQPPAWDDAQPQPVAWDDAQAQPAAWDDRSEAYGRTAPGGSQAPAPDAAEPAQGTDHHRPSRQELAPWAHGRGTGSAGVATIVAAKVGPAPVFVDDSGRRRRAGRLVGTTVVVAVAAYTAVIALTLAGVPMVGQVAPPGIDRLARPAGDTRVVTGPSAEEVPLPPPPEETTSSATTTGSSDASEGDSSTASGGTDPTGSTSPSTTTGATTTTTAVHGPSTTLTSPGTTAPGRGNGSGRPPEPPGQG